MNDSVLPPSDSGTMSAILKGISSSGLPRPTIVLAWSGSILLEWQHQGMPSVDIDFSNHTASFHAFGKDEQDVFRDFRLDKEMEQFFNFLSEFFKQD